MKKTFVAILVLVLVLVGCTPTPEVSIAKPMETVAPQSKPEVATQDFKEITSAELYTLFGDHFPAESLGYSKENKGTLFLINNQKYLITDPDFMIQLYNDTLEYRYFANPDGTTSEPSQNISINSKGMMFMESNNNGEENIYAACFVSNETTAPGFEKFGDVGYPFVNFDQIQGKSGSYYISFPCNVGMLINDADSKTSVYMQDDVRDIRLLDEYGNVKDSDYGHSGNQTVFSYYGYPYLGFDEYFGEEFLLITDNALDLGILSNLVTKLQDSWDKLPEIYTTTSFHSKSAYTVENIDTSCKMIRNFWKFLPDVTVEDVKNACGGKISFEDLVGITTNTTDGYSVGFNEVPSNIYSDALQHWYFGIGDSLLKGYNAQVLRMGSTQVDPFTFISRTGQTCLTNLNKEGEIIAIVSSLGDTPKSVVRCMNNGYYLYLVPGTDPYIQYNDMYNNPKALVYSLN